MCGGGGETPLETIEKTFNRVGSEIGTTGMKWNPAIRLQEVVSNNPTFKHWEDTGQKLVDKGTGQAKKDDYERRMQLNYEEAQANYQATATLAPTGSPSAGTGSTQGTSSNVPSWYMQQLGGLQLDASPAIGATLLNSGGSGRGTLG